VEVVIVSWNRGETERGYKNPILEKKKIRLNTTRGILENNSPMKYSRAIAMVIYNTGISRRTAIEYLNIFVDLGVIEIKNNMIYLIEQRGK